jgi:nicotinate-nucleotide adenylyltransferase
MKIGIMGGTFDPPHIGHLVIAEQAFVQLHLDKVWFAPVGQPPHKDLRRVTETHHRVEMTCLAIRDNPNFELTEADVNRPTPHYITTLFELFCEQHPDWEWYLIIGGDSFMELPRWHEPKRLLQLARLAVALRPGFKPRHGKPGTVTSRHQHAHPVGGQPDDRPRFARPATARA